MHGVCPAHVISATMLVCAVPPVRQTSQEVVRIPSRATIWFLIHEEGVSRSFLEPMRKFCQNRSTFVFMVRFVHVVWPTVISVRLGSE